MQERIDTKEKRALYFYDSLSELAQYLDRTPQTWKGYDSSRKSGGGTSWDLGAGYDKAWDMARNGWIEGAQRAQEALQVFAPSSPAPDTRNDFYGHMPHVPRYCSGAPDNMIRHDKAKGSGRVLTIICPVNATANVSAKSMSNFGVAVAQYINQMEMQNIRCEVIGILVNDAGSWHVSHAWRVKYADQPLDLAVLSFAVGHPAMFRRLGFALLERCAAPASPSYGRSIPALLADVVNVPAGAVVLNGMTRANEIAPTPEKALKYIEEQINKVLDNPEAI